MADIQNVRIEVLDRYKQLCGKISHTPNASFVRTVGNSTVKSFYLDLIFRGNEKLHFGNRFTDRDIILLSSALEGHEKLIRNIDLSFNEISDVGIEIFAKFIEKCPNIESLNLQGNSLGAPSAERLSAALATAESLKYLNLQYNKIGTAGAISITKNLLFSSNEEQGMSIEQLNLGDCGLDIDGVICVTSVLNWNNSTLRSLNLDCPDYRSIGQQCAVHFAKMLQVNRGLQKLSLRKNQLNCDAIYTIKQLSMENNRLRVLDLAANKISFKGAEALHDLLTSKFCVIQSLNLASNRLGHYGAKAIAQALAKNRTLIHLDMTHNSIDDNGLKMVAQSLETNDNLVSLKLYFNEFGQLALREFHKLAKKQEKVATYWDFTTYVVDNQIQMAQVDNFIKYDVSVSRPYYS